MDKTRIKNARSPPFSYDTLGAQSINADITQSNYLLSSKEVAKPRDTNRSLLDQLKEAESSASGSETNSADVVLERIPKFKSMAEQLKWKLNKARKRLRVAKQYVALADKIASAKNKHDGRSNSVKDIIKKAEVALVHAGENMGLDYVHFKRSVDY